MGEAQGKKVVSESVASQTIEAQPVFGQIKPSQRPGASRAETQSWEKRWLISVMLYKRSEPLGVEKETQCGKWRSQLPRATVESNVLARLCGAGLRSTPPGQGAPVEGRDYLSLKFDDPSFNAPIYANLFDDAGEEIIPLAWQPRELAEDCRRPPRPVRLVGAP